MESALQTSDIAHVIALSVAPVFLLTTIAWLFIASMVALIASLLTFLREIRLGSASLRIGKQ